MQPAWLPNDAWVRLKDLGKLFPYNKVKVALRHMRGEGIKVRLSERNVYQGLLTYMST